VRARRAAEEIAVVRETEVDSGGTMCTERGGLRGAEEGMEKRDAEG